MKKISMSLILLAAGLASGCGARTSEDDLLGPYRPDNNPGDGDGAGGDAGDGDGDTGGRSGSGGVISSGGFTSAGGVIILPTGGNTSSGGRFPSGGDTGAGGANPSGDCCISRTSPGCESPSVETCVCTFDDFCCRQAWDQACVDEADRFCQAECSFGAGGAIGIGGSGIGGSGIGGSGSGGVPGIGGSGSGGVPGIGGAFSGDCCEAHDGRGCEAPIVEMCVCSLDPFCCETTWDQLCADEAQNKCNASCMAGAGGGMSTGGVPGAGGISGTGGIVEQCSQLFNDDCGRCLCTDCFDQFSSCLGDLGCLAILACIDRTDCNGFNCYQQNTCQVVIDTFGGLSGTSTQNALGLGACAASSGCGCF